MRRNPTTRVALAVLAGLSLLLAYELARAIGIASRLANEDTSIVWVAARDWMARRFRQPNYYGQSYGSTLEAIPIGVLHALGASYGFATSVVAATLEFAAWAALAWAAWHRGRRVMAALAFGIPLALAAYHTVYVTIELQVPGPRLLVVVACALLIAFPTRPVPLGCAVLLFGVGLQFDASSALLAAPAIVWYVVSYLRTRHQLFAVAAGAVLPVVQFVGTRLFYRRHPDYELHPSPSIRPSVNTLTGSAHHLSEFFGLYAPELWRSWIAPLAVLAILVVLLLATRRFAYVLPAAAVAVIVPYAMSTSRAEASASLGPLLPRGRILLALPATLWFLTLLVAESGMFGRVRADRGTRRALAAVCVVCATSTVVRAADFGGREGFWYARSIALQAIGQYGFAPNSLMQRQCDDDVAFARRNAVGLIVYADQHAAYSCAAWGTFRHHHPRALRAAYLGSVRWSSSTVARVFSSWTIRVRARLPRNVGRVRSAVGIRCSRFCANPRSLFLRRSASRFAASDHVAVPTCGSASAARVERTLFASRSRRDRRTPNRRAPRSSVPIVRCSRSRREPRRSRTSNWGIDSASSCPLCNDSPRAPHRP